MTADELRAIGAALYGHGWQSKLAAAIGIDRKTVGRWLDAGRVSGWAEHLVRNLAAPKARPDGAGPGFGAGFPPPPDDKARWAACEAATRAAVAEVIASAEAAGWTSGEVLISMFGVTRAALNPTQTRKAPPHVDLPE